MDCMLKALLLVTTIAAAAAPGAFAQQPTAADFARNMQGAVGQVLQDGFTLKNITNEENTLVLVVDGNAGWREGLTPQDISASLVYGFCESAPNFFTTGVTMRVDSLDAGTLIKGPLVNECPAPGAPPPFG